jgi:thioredoxin
MPAEEDEIKSVLEKYRTVAIVGLSSDPTKASHEVAQFLKSRGWQIIPVNPFATEILGKKSFKSLLDMPEDLQKAVEVVDIFRPSQDVPPIVDQAIELKNKNGKPYVVWMQLGIVNEKAAAKARKAGLTVIMDHCMKIESERLEKEKEENMELRSLREQKLKELKTTMKRGTSQNTPLTLTDATFQDTVKAHALMLVDCWAAWCGPCRMIAPVIDELARDYNGRIVVAKLNVDENPQTAEQFCVVSIPTLLIMKNGNEVDRIIGVCPKQVIEEKLQKQM